MLSIVSSCNSAYFLINNKLSKPPPIQNLTLVSSTNNAFLISFTDPSNINNYVCQCTSNSAPTQTFNKTSNNNVILNNLTSETTYVISVVSKTQTTSDPISITAMTLSSWAKIAAYNPSSYASYNINNTGYIRTVGSTTNMNSDVSFIIPSLNGIAFNSGSDPSFNSNAYSRSSLTFYSNVQTYIQSNNNITFYLKSRPNATGARYFTFNFSSGTSGAATPRFYISIDTTNRKYTIQYREVNLTDIITGASNVSFPAFFTYAYGIYNVFNVISGGYVSGYIYDDSGNLLGSGTSPTSRSGTNLYSGYNNNYIGWASINTYASSLDMLYFNIYKSALTTTQMSNFSNKNNNPYI